MCCSACSKIERLRRHRSIASPKEPLWSAPRPDRRLGCAASGNLTCASGKPRAISWSAQSGDQERHDGTHRNLKSLMINAIQRWELILSCLEHSYPGHFAAARDRAAWMAYSWHHNGWMRRGIYDTPERTALLAGISVGHAELLEELRGGVQAQAISCVGQGGLGGDKHDDLQRLLNLVPESLPAVTIAADPPIVDSSGSEAGASN